MKPRRLGRWVGVAVGVCVAAEVAIGQLSCAGDGDAYTGGWANTRLLGWTALVALCATLCVSPLARLYYSVRPEPSAWVREIRRALGLTAASAALAHALLALATVPATSAGLFAAPRLRSGAAALLVLVVLYLTSFQTLVRRLHLAFWKPLHRLAYLALVLAAHHALTSAFVSAWAVGWLVGATLLVGALRFVPLSAARRSRSL